MFGAGYFGPGYFGSGYWGGLSSGSPIPVPAPIVSAGTYTFSPEIDEWIVEAFECCGIDPATLDGRHMKSARRSLNLLFSDWEARGDATWRVDEQTQALSAGVASYTAPAGTMSILPGHVVVRRDDVDLAVAIIGREEYHAIPRKSERGLPTSLFYDQATSTFFLWLVPENSTDELLYWRVRRIQTALTSLDAADARKQWFNALAKGLAWQLAFKFAPRRVKMLEEAHEMAFLRAMASDRERTDTTFGLAS